MLDGCDIEAGGVGEPIDDRYLESALLEMRVWFDVRPREVFYSRQLEIIHERKYFHWVTNTALRQLAEAGEIRVDRGGPGQPNVLFHASHRYPKRQIARVRELIAEHSDAEKNHAIGDHCEDLVERAFGRAGFRFLGAKVRELGNRKWTESEHDLDLVFERDGLRYGIEVKNTLGYSNLGDEVALKTRLALQLDCQPLFVARSLPKTWNYRIISANGLVLLFGHQLQPKAMQATASRMQNELQLPVRVARDFPDGDMLRFLRAHEKLRRRLRGEDRDGASV